MSSIRNNHSLTSVGSYALQKLAGSFDRIHEKQDFPLEPEAELPVQIVAGVELVVVQLSTAARPASSPYDAFR
ncbi:hypothetical protein A2U01_0074171, partial [Trifolium medium]|nr:hypothetical protein [Trifolium medium]